MLRFALDPAGLVVPDIARRLPGRGVWTLSSRAIVEAAVRKRVFARAFKAPARAPDDLAEIVDTLLERAALQALSIATKAGAVVSGSAKVEKALAGGKVAALVHAADGGEDGRRKVGQASRRAGGAAVEISLFTGAALDRTLGRPNVVRMALAPGGATANFLACCGRLEAYRSPSDRAMGIPDEHPADMAGTPFDAELNERAEPGEHRSHE